MLYQFIFFHEKESGLKKAIPEAFLENRRYFVVYDVPAKNLAGALNSACQKKLELNNTFAGWDVDGEILAGKEFISIEEAVKKHPEYEYLID